MATSFISDARKHSRQGEVLQVRKVKKSTGYYPVATLPAFWLSIRAAVVAWLAFLLMGLESCGTKEMSFPEDIEARLPEKIDFNYHIKPILSDRCFACHGPDENKVEAGLRFDIEEKALTKLESGKRAIVPGNVSDSELFHRIISEENDYQMPPPESNLTLSAYEKALLVRWIEQGAEYKPHWSFITPQKPEIPEVSQKQWIKNPIDHFVLSKLEKNGLPPSEEADKETLIRRVTFDLTGLPPTVAEIDAFLADPSPDAYEKVVDRLLASPHYGERMATEWLDVARYADTYGYTVDRYRPVWPWRDWVIKAFNENMPFDQFVTWQLAGDMLPNPTKEQMLATGFNRMHAQNAEGGIVNEEFRVEYVADRTNTFGKAFLGLTMECARCHDHKYDPVTQKEYYQLFGFFNNVDESGQITFSLEDMPAPTLLLPDSAVEEKIAYLERMITRKEQEIDTLKTEKKEEFQQWLAATRHNTSLSDKMPSGLIAHYPLDAITNEKILNIADHRKNGKVADPVTEQVAVDTPLVIEGKRGKGVQMNGDDALYFPQIGRFLRAEPFSVGLWVKVPEKLENGVIFHANRGAIIYNFKGYQVSVEENKLDVRFAHAFPYNAIHLVSENTVPKEEWIHLMLTYDGSSKAAGVRFYLNGELLRMKVKRDHLYKEIAFVREDITTHLKAGGQWRARGLTGGALDEITVFNRELTPLEVAGVAGKPALTDLLKQSPEAIPESSYQDLLAYYLANNNKVYQKELHALKALRTEKNTLTEAVQEVMVMDEMEAPRPTYLLERGSYAAQGEEVHPGTPQQVMSFPDTLTKNRMGLAQWLMHPDNPLTGRVIVNRYWQQYFGKGIVTTPDDFGNQGDLPTHPELLDWLAIRFVESGWNVKAFQKEIVMSATYRQSSYTSQELREKDPENLLLARGPKMRLTAEMLRDNALAASGLLVRKIGGPSVKPYQPEGLWIVNGAEYIQDTGEDLYRRSMYTFWKRTVPPPTMNTFDAPDRSYCVVKRQKTSTPLQSLILMNDPQFVEASRMIAERVMKEAESEDDRITYTFRLLTSRKPTQQESDILRAMYQEQYLKFSQTPEKTKGLLEAGAFPADRRLDRPVLAAHTVIVNTIMNHDASVIKR